MYILVKEDTKPCSLQYPPLHILNGGEEISETSMLISCTQILIHALILCAWFYLHFCQPCNSFFISPLSLSSTQKSEREQGKSMMCCVHRFLYPKFYLLKILEVDKDILFFIYLIIRYLEGGIWNSDVSWKTTKVLQGLKPKAKIKQNNQTNKPKRLMHGLTRLTKCKQMRGWLFVSECHEELVNLVGQGYLFFSFFSFFLFLFW